MEENKRTNSILKQLEGIKALSGLFEAKTQYAQMKDTRTTSVAQLTVLMGISEENASKLLDELLEKGLENVQSMTLQDKRDLLSKYADSGFYNDCDEETCNTTLKTITEVQAMMDELDKSIADYEEQMDQVEEEVRNLTAEYGDINNLLQTNLRQVLEEDHSEKVYQAAKEQLNALYGAMNLDRVKQLYETIGVENTKKEFADNNRKMSMIHRYEEVMKRLGIKATLTSFLNHDLESHINEDCVCKTDLLLYAIIKYEAGKTFTATKFYDGMFMVQLAINFYQLFTGMMTPENEKTFVTALNSLSKMFRD